MYDFFRQNCHQEYTYVGTGYNLDNQALIPSSQGFSLFHQVKNNSD
jgi:hypothetical protein